MIKIEVPNIGAGVSGQFPQRKLTKTPDPLTPAPILGSSKKTYTIKKNPNDFTLDVYIWMIQKDAHFNIVIWVLVIQGGRVRTFKTQVGLHR